MYQLASASKPTYLGMAGDQQARYNQVLAGYGQQATAFNNTTGALDQAWKRMMTDMQGVGDSQRIALDQDFSRRQAQMQQSMISRGMGNSTVLDSAARGIGYDRANARIALQDQLNREQTALKQNWLGYRGQAQQGYAALQGQRLGFMGQAASESTPQAYYVPNDMTMNQPNNGVTGVVANQMGGSSGGGFQPFTSFEKGSANWLQPSGLTGGYYVGGGGWGASPGGADNYGYGGALSGISTGYG